MLPLSPRRLFSPPSTLVDGLTEAELRAQDLGDQVALTLALTLTLNLNLNLNLNLQVALDPLNATLPWPLGSFFEMDEDWPIDVDRKCVEVTLTLTRNPNP
jgi:hypothetical protein